MPSTVSNDASTILPLLFAAHPTLIPDYRRMAAMDDLGRTQAALEHKFRTWRQDGKKIAAAKGGIEDVKSVTKKAVSTTGAAREKKAPRASKTAKDVEDESGETEDDAQPNAKASNAANAHNNVANTSVPVSKKRPAASSADNTGKPIKKACVTKKGTAQKVHRPARKPRETVEEVTSSEEAEAEQKTKVTRTTSRARENAIFGPSSPMITDEVDGEVKFEDLPDGPGEDLVEMGFDHGD